MSQPEGSLLAQTRRLLRHYDLRARKGLGQHFLISGKVLSLIIATAQLEADDLVVEVGPGLGVLTRELAKRAGRVVAIELDEKLAAALAGNLADFKNIIIINQDVLNTDLTQILGELEAARYKVVANLPYYITSPVLRHFLEAELKPQMMVVTVQKEVAEEITAKPGRMSLLSIGVQLYGEPRIVARVPAGAFYPAPAVDSAVLKVVPYSQPRVEISNREGFFGLVRAGFSAARKQLANSLAQGLGISKQDVQSLLEKAGIDSRRRAETLSIEEWAHLWQAYQEMR